MGRCDEELRIFRDRCLLIAEFIGGLRKSLAAAEIPAIAHQEFERRNLRGLQMMVQGVEQWARSLSATEKSKLDELLRSKLGQGLDEGRDAEIASIVGRGAIGDSEEFRLLKDYVDEICDDARKQDEMQTIVELLHRYEDQLG